MPLITKAAQRQENKNAFYNFSEKKHFDIEKIVGTSDSGNDTESIYVYEKGNDCESLFILRESWINAEIKKSGIWTVGDIYSTLEHGKEYTESELREMIKKGKVTSKY